VTCEVSDNNRNFETNLLKDPRFIGGQEFETRKLIPPKIFHFNNYLFVTGNTNNGGNSSLGLFFNNTEIHYETSQDGFYDTIFTANINNDGIPDFLVSYAYEDGATLHGLLSHSATDFSSVKLFDEWYETNCIESGDTIQNLLPLQIRDIDGDIRDDIIVNLVQIGGRRFAISCTDTVFGSTVK
jgi:hypothetical protein